MSSEIIISENLSRFIFSRNHIRSSNNTVKYAAFLPHINSETSVFIISGLTDDRIWNIGVEVEEKRTQSLKGRADINSTSVIENGLKIVLQEPPPRHANITNWPSEKSKQKEIALKLASESRLYLKNSAL